MQTGSTGSKDALCYVAIMTTGFQWCLYGLFAYFYTNNHGFLIVVYANIFGFLLGTFYTFTYQRFVQKATSQYRGLQMYYVFVGTVMAIQFIAFCIRPEDQSLLLSGCLSATLSTITTVSPLKTIPTVIRTKSLDSMPVEVALVSFGSCVLWVICGVMLGDPWILVPNSIGIVVGVICCVLVAKYGKFGPLASDSESSKSSIKYFSGNKNLKLLKRDYHSNSAAEETAALMAHLKSQIDIVKKNKSNSMVSSTMLETTQTVPTLVPSSESESEPDSNDSNETDKDSESVSASDYGYGTLIFSDNLSIDDDDEDDVNDDDIINLDDHDINDVDSVLESNRVRFTESMSDIDGHPDVSETVSGSTLSYFTDTISNTLSGLGSTLFSGVMKFKFSSDSSSNINAGTDHYNSDSSKDLETMSLLKNSSINCNNSYIQNQMGPCGTGHSLNQNNLIHNPFRKVNENGSLLSKLRPITSASGSPNINNSMSNNCTNNLLSSPPPNNLQNQNNGQNNSTNLNIINQINCGSLLKHGDSMLSKRQQKSLRIQIQKKRAAERQRLLKSQLLYSITECESLSNSAESDDQSPGNIVKHFDNLPSDSEVTQLNVNDCTNDSLSCNELKSDIQIDSDNTADHDHQHSNEIHQCSPSDCNSESDLSTNDPSSSEDSDSMTNTSTTSSSPCSDIDSSHNIDCNSNSSTSSVSSGSSSASPDKISICSSSSSSASNSPISDKEEGGSNLLTVSLTSSLSNSSEESQSGKEDLDDDDDSDTDSDGDGGTGGT